MNAYSFTLYGQNVRSRVIRQRKRGLFENAIQTGGKHLKQAFSNTIRSGEPSDFPGRDFFTQK